MFFGPNSSLSWTEEELTFFQMTNNTTATLRIYHGNPWIIPRQSLDYTTATLGTYLPTPKFCIQLLAIPNAYG